MVEIYRMEFEITGKRIQKAGFRSAIEDIALDLGITGTVKNKEGLDESGMKVYSVHVVAEGKKDGLKAFIEQVNATNTFHKVDKVDLSVLDSAEHVMKRQFPEFSITRKEGEIPERMDEAVFYVKDMYKEMHGLNNGMNALKEETHSNFKTMEDKYHTISDNLNFFVDVVAEYAAVTKPELKESIEKLKEKYKH